MLVYNVQDANYYDCAETTYTAGYFAPDYADSIGMNVIVIDAFDWANRVGPDDSEWRDDDPSNDQATLYEGVVAHELEHLLHSYSDPGELSWVDEGLADFAVFLNGFDVGGSHLTYQQVFYADTSLTRWGGGLQNYGAAYTFFQYLWEQAGGNGDGTYTPDLQYDGAGGDLLIKLIFAEQDDGMIGVQNAIDDFNAGPGPDLRSAEDLFQDWAVAVYLDDEASPRFDIKAVDFGDPAFTSWTIDIADELFWSDRGSNQGAQPAPKWERRANAQSPTAVPFGLHVERFRNPGPTSSWRSPVMTSARWRRTAHRRTGMPATRAVGPHPRCGRRRARDLVRLLDVALHRGRLGLWVRRGARRRRVGDRAGGRRQRRQCDHRRRPAREQHRRERDHRHVGR